MCMGKILNVIDLIVIVVELIVLFVSRLPMWTGRAKGTGKTEHDTWKTHEMFQPTDNFHFIKLCHYHGLVTGAGARQARGGGG